MLASVALPLVAGKAAQHAERIGLAQLFLAAQAVVLLVKVIRHKVDSGARCRLPPQRTAHRVHVAIVDLLAVVSVERVAIAVKIEPGHSQPQRVADGQVDHALGLDAVEVAVFRFGSSVDAVELRLGGDEVDHARGRVAAEQGALRTTQHFDALEIEVLGFEQAGGEQRSTVDVDRGRAVARSADAQIADPADGEARPGEVALSESHVGQGQLKIAGVLDLLLFQRLAAERRHCDRNRLQRLRLALGGDDNDIARGLGGSGLWLGILREGGTAQRKCQYRGGCAIAYQTRKCVKTHCPTLPCIDLLSDRLNQRVTDIRASASGIVRVTFFPDGPLQTCRRSFGVIRKAELRAAAWQCGSSAKSSRWPRWVRG
jgi:hypothetical protein